MLVASVGSLAQADDGRTPDLVPYPERDAITLRSTLGHKGVCSWQMKPASEAGGGAEVSSPNALAEGWRNAIVPGTVLNSLVAAGDYPEPYFGANNERGAGKIPDISEVGPAFYTYWFRSKFTIPDSYAGKTVWMQEDTAALDDWKPEFIPGGFASHCVNNTEQIYQYSPNPEGAVHRASRRKDGWFRTTNGEPVIPGRRQFHDYNF